MAKISTFVFINIVGLSDKNLFRPFVFMNIVGLTFILDYARGHYE